MARTSSTPVVEDQLGGAQLAAERARAARPAGRSRPACPATPMSATARAASAGHQTQPGPRDDAERAFAAGEERGEVVAGVVLGHAAEPADDGAVGQHHLEPEHLRAHAAVAQHADAAGVGGDQAADGRAVAGGEVDAEVEAGGSGMGLQRSEPYAGAGRHLTGSRRRSAPAWSSRARLSSTSPPPGTPPPTSPVLPPWTATAIPAAPHARSTAETSSVSAGPHHQRGRARRNARSSRPRTSGAAPDR